MSRLQRNLGWAVGFALLLAAAALLLGQLPPEDHADGLPTRVQGSARVVDADTWIVAGTRLRIDGIDAPELAQPCGEPDRSWPCGRAAAEALRAHLRGREVGCRLHGRDRHGRALASCHADGEDLQRWLVRNGWAVAYGSSASGDDYTVDELLAQHQRIGIWRTGLERPQRWRQRQAKP